MAGTTRFVKRLLGGLGIALLGAVAAILIAYVLWARAQPPLQLWHQVHLDAGIHRRKGPPGRHPRRLPGPGSARLRRNG